MDFRLLAGLVLFTLMVAIIRRVVIYYLAGINKAERITQNLDKVDVIHRTDLILERSKYYLFGFIYDIVVIVISVRVGGILFKGLIVPVFGLGVTWIWFYLALLITFSILIKRFLFST